VVAQSFNHQFGVAGDVLVRVRALPGVEVASVVNIPPLGILGTSVNFEIEGRPAAAPGEALGARFQIIDPDYFKTLRLPLIAGRAFETGDADESRGVAIISETFARRFFAGPDAIGRRIRPHFPKPDLDPNPTSGLGIRDPRPRSSWTRP
jgi:hypothetical protein